ncbi:MAG: plastocyanin/azurin family copper-binding protein [Methanoregula sp.]|nr:plastocyanin/azurin family copper-binding protein [Methanoregula sp.]
MRAIAVLMIVLVCVAFTSGCTDQNTSQKTTPVVTQTAQTVRITSQASNGMIKEVSITATSFNPRDLYITAGTTVRWVNEDRMPRNVVHLPTGATDKELFNSGSLSPGERFSYTFYTPGRYVYGDPQHGGGRSPFVNVTD